MYTVNFIGNFTAKPVKRQGKSGKEYSTFSVGVNVGKDSSVFVDCVAFGSLVNLLDTFGDKGGRVAVSGRVTLENYKAKDGTNKTSQRVVVNDVAFLSEK